MIRESQPGYVYAMGCASGPIKVGWAVDPEKRRRELQTGNPERLFVLAIEPGDRQRETAAHTRLAAARVHGEWFERSAVRRDFELELPDTALGFYWPASADMCPACHAVHWPSSIREKLRTWIVFRYACLCGNGWDCGFAPAFAKRGVEFSA